MGKRTKLKSNYLKRSKRTRKYSFKKRKNTMKRRKQKGGAPRPKGASNQKYYKIEDTKKIIKFIKNKIENFQEKEKFLETIVKDRGELADWYFNSDSFNYKTLLMYVSEYGFTSLVDDLLIYSNCEKVEKYKGYTALHYACLNGHIEIVKKLLDKNNNVINFVNNERETPLHLASKNGHTEIVDLLIKNGAITDEGNKYGYTPLHWASQNGNIDIVKALLANGADPTIVDTKDNYTPLHVVSFKGYTEIVRELLQNYPDFINEVDKQKYTALHWASKEGHTETVEILLENGAETNKSTIKNNTPLHLASMEGHTDTVKILLENGADPTRVEKDNNTPLHLASRKGHTDTVEILLKNGADPKMVEKNRYTPLHIASFEGHTEIVRKLLENCPDIINEVDNQKNTALHWASREGHTDTVNLLLNKVDNIDPVNETGDTPLLCASRRNNNKNTAEVLLNAGANIDIEKQGSSEKFLKSECPLVLALINRKLNLVNLLLERGANLNVMNNCIKKGGQDYRFLIDKGKINFQRSEQQIKTLIINSFQKRIKADELHDLIQDAAEQDDAEKKAITFLQPTNLKTNPININVRNANGQTILIKAIQNGYDQVAKEILDLSQKLKLDVTVIDNAKKTALDYAIEKYVDSQNDNFLNIIKTLIEKGSIIKNNPNHTNKERYQVIQRIINSKSADVDT